MNNRASTRCFLLPDCLCVSVRRKSSVLKCCYNTIAQKGRSFPISNWWLGLSCRTRCSGEALLNPRVRSVLTFRRVFHRRSDGFQWEKGLRVWSVVPFRDQCRGWINGPFTETAQEFFWCLLFFFPCTYLTFLFLTIFFAIFLCTLSTTYRMV